MLLLEELVNINKRTWDYEDITYWTNPKDNTCNATIIFNGKSSRLRAGIIILNGDEILLGEEADEPGVFSLPGGGLEENETPLQAAIREAQEEVYINVKEAVDTKFDYCECHDEVKDWVKENVPKNKWWYNYYTCLIIAKYDGEYTGKVDKVDQDKSMKSSAKWYKIDEVIDDPSFKSQWKKAIEAYRTHPLDEELSEIIAYHWSPKSFDNIKPNYQGIHLSTTIETCKDLATNRGLDFKKGNLYKYILDAKNLKPASFDIDILDWSANEIAILLINKIKNKNVYGATFGTDEEGNNWKDNVDNSVVNIDNLNYADLETLEKIRATQDKKLALKLLVQFLKEKNYNCIKYANFGESSRGDICYILFDNKLILSGTRIDPKALPEKYNKADYRYYTYNGPVYRFSTYMGNLELKTMAVSLAKAINNLKFQAAKAYGYDRAAGANFKIKEEKVKVLSEKDANSKDIDITDIDPESIEASKIKYCQTCGTRLNDAGECPVCDLGDEEVLKYESLLEDTRAQLANASKKAGEYKNKERGKNRWERKKYSKVSTQVKSYNQINMNEFFKQDILQVKIPVQGETDEYTVTIKLEGVVEEIARHIKQHNNQFEFKTVLQSLTKVFNTKNVYVKCTCEDFCLHPDTKIKLLDGTTITVEELEQKVKASSNPVYLYSVDDKGDFKPGKIKNVWVSGYADKMIKITLDNGKSIITTENHQYLLRNGQYKEAQYLKIGDSLMPLYFGTTVNGYDSVKANSKATTEFYSTYKQVAATLLQKEIEEAKLRSGEDKIAIHHKDFNKSNNSPENLQPMGVQEHYKYHYEHVFDSGAFDKFKAGSEEYRKLVMDHNTPEYQKQAKVMSTAIKDYWNNLTPEERKKDSERKSETIKQAWKNGSYDTVARKAADEKRKLTLHTPEMEKASADGIRQYWANLTDEEREQVIAQRKKNLAAGIGWNKGKHLSDEDRLHKSQAALNRTPEEKAEHNRKIRDTKMLNVFNKMISDKVALTAENYEFYRRNYFKSAPSLNKYFNTIDAAIQYFKLNHKITKIEIIKYDLLQPVYDIEVENYHNFYVDAGVILHNCYRFAHWSIINNYSVDDTSKDPGPGRGITNPNNDKGKGCKHILLCIANGSWIMKVSSVIMNYCNYAAEHMKKLFLKLIFPKLYGIPADDAIEDNLVPEDTNLETDTNLIDTINQWAKDRGKFKKGSNKNPITGTGGRKKKEEEPEES